MLKKLIITVILIDILSITRVQSDLDNYLINWEVEKLNPSWFQRGKARNESSTLLMPFLLFLFQYKEYYHRVNCLHLVKFTRDMKLKKYNTVIDLQSVVTRMKRYGVPVDLRHGLYSFNKKLKYNYQKPIVFSFIGESKLIRELRRGPILTQINLNWFKNYKGGVVDSSVCEGRNIKSKYDKDTVIITGINKDKEGNYYYEIFTSKPNNWGNKGKIFIKIRNDERNNYIYEGKYLVKAIRGIDECGLSRGFYRFTLHNEKISLL